jgi:hypothetical protein
MILILIAGFCLIGIEIWVDTLLWKRKLNDKPFTTISWLILVMVLSLFLPGWYHHNVLLFLATRFLFFDFALNVVRWKKIPLTWSVYSPHETKFQLLIMRLFYHGENKKKFSYDWIMGKLPWYFELFFKLLTFASAILIRYNWSFLDEIWYWIVNLFA